MSWQEIAGRDDPVRGDLAQFDLARARWRIAAQSATDLRNAFAEILNVDSALQGKAARAFADIVAECQAVLDDVPSVCNDLANAMENHHNQLRVLRIEADRALARAQTSWVARETAAVTAKQQAARLTSIEAQLEQLRLVQQPDHTRVVALEAEASSTKTALASASGNRDSANERVKTELAKWDELRRDEDSLNSGTAKRLKDINLRSLRDKGWLENQAVKVTEFLGDFQENLQQLGEAIAAGDIERVLFECYELLDQVITVLEVVGVVVLVVVAAVVVFASGGTLAPVVVAIAPVALDVIKAMSLGLGAVKVGLGGALLASGYVNPETGEPIRPSDLMIDMASLMPSSGTKRSMVDRAFGKGAELADDAGTIPLRNVEGELVEKGVEIRLDHSARSTWHGVEDELRGTDAQPSDPRVKDVMSDLDAIVTQYRGLCAPVTTVVVGTY